MTPVESASPEPGSPAPAPGPLFDPQGPPLPNRQIMSQWWRDITFLHWRVDPDRVAPLLPRGTTPDLFDGATWVGLIPFRMVDAGVGRGGPVPWAGSFLETNVRLYSVDEQGRHGVVFRSLEAQRLPVVAGARLGFNVPYQWASMSARRRPGPPGSAGPQVTYASRRLSLAGRPTSRVTVEIGPPLREPPPLAHFLTARFGLHTRAYGATRWVPNTHGPWPLRHASVIELDDRLLAAAGLPGVVDAGPPESVLFSEGVRTVFGVPQTVPST